MSISANSPNALPQDSMRGKICMVTGANAGIGKATALGLAKLGATVMMVCRDSDRGKAARDEISRESNNSAVELLVADLSSQEAIHNLVADYKSSHDKLHVLVNNAGANTQQRTLTSDGIELNFAVNYLACFLLTNLLLDVLKAGAPSRVVNVTSSAEGFGSINFDDLTLEQNYTWMRAHAQSKLAQVMFTYKLARGLAGMGVTVNCVNPGAVRTNFTKDLGGWFGLMARLARPFALTPEKGAEPILYLATSSDVDGISGKYFEKMKAAQSSKTSQDQELARQLWQVSETLTQLESTSVPSQ